MTKVLKTKLKSRYIKQPTRFACGPTALYNLVKWASNFTLNKQPANVTYKKIHQMCDCKPPHGTLFKDFDKTLKKTVSSCKNLKFKSLKMHNQVNLKDLTDSLKDPGQAALVEFHWEDPTVNGDHYVFIDRVESANYTTMYNIVNPDDKAELSDTEKKINKRTMKSTLRPFEYKPAFYKDKIDNVFPKVWIVEKKKIEK